MRRTSPEWPFRPGAGGRRMFGAEWRHDSGLRALPARWRRKREPWEVEWEAFDGAYVLEDLPTSQSEQESARIIARYLALRLVLLAARTRPAAATLAAEQVAAAAYLPMVGPPGGAESQALDRAIRLTGSPPSRSLCEALCRAGDEAVKAMHFAGAFALCRTAYHLGLEAWTPVAAQKAAERITDIARLAGGRRSVRLWSRRARVLARRAAAETAGGTRPPRQQTCQPPDSGGCR